MQVIAEAEERGRLKAQSAIHARKKKELEEKIKRLDSAHSALTEDGRGRNSAEWAGIGEHPRVRVDDVAKLDPSNAMPTEMADVEKLLLQSHKPFYGPRFDDAIASSSISTMNSMHSMSSISGISSFSTPLTASEYSTPLDKYRASNTTNSNGNKLGGLNGSVDKAAAPTYVGDGGGGDNGGNGGSGGDGHKRVKVDVQFNSGPPEGGKRKEKREPRGNGLRVDVYTRDADADAGGGDDADADDEAGGGDSKNGFSKDNNDDEDNEDNNDNEDNEDNEGAFFEVIRSSSSRSRGGGRSGGGGGGGGGSGSGSGVESGESDDASGDEGEDSVNLTNDPKFHEEAEYR
jgi:hypothetical protein